MSIEMLNDEDYKIILQNYSKNPNIKYVSSKFIPLSDNVEGFMGDYYTLEIIFQDEEEKTATFFVKTLPCYTDLQKMICAQRNVFAKEIFFYNFLMKEYEKLGYDTSFAPKCYYCKDNKILIMENLVGIGFKLPEKNILYDLEQIKAGLKALALFHSASIMYEEEMTKNLKRQFRLNEEYPEMFKENYLDPEHDEVFSKGIFQKTVDSITYIIDNTENNYDKDKFKAFLKPHTILKGLFEATNLRKAVGHGDLWNNNIFFNNPTINCKLVDYQILRYSLPVLDVLLFIHLNTSKEFRGSHKKNLLSYYYSTLKDIFLKHNYDISKLNSVEELNFVEITAMFGVLTTGTLTFMPPELIQEIYDMQNEDWINNNKLMVEKAFNNNKKYRKAIIDAVDDLYNSIVRNND